MSKLAFWISIVLFLYTYLGYPLLGWLLAHMRRRNPVPRRENPPVGETDEPSVLVSVSIVVVVHNEEDVIAQRLSNLESLQYPRGALEIIVASDGSDDRTNEIVSRWPDDRVRLVSLPRGGRAVAHNEAVLQARGRIIVFTDAESTFHPEFVTKIVQAFGDDPEVGCVVGRLVWNVRGSSLGMNTKTYWRLETALRQWESDAGLLAVGTGCCMAIRRELFRRLHQDEDLDNATPLDVMMQGHQVVFAADAVAFDRPPSTLDGEIRARARMTVLALTGILRRRMLLNPFRFPRAALALLSHRILRYLTPVWVAVVLVSSSLLAQEPLYRFALGFQGAFYGLGVLGALGRGATFGNAMLRIPTSFCVWNLGFATGLIRILLGRRVTTYMPA